MANKVSVTEYYSGDELTAGEVEFEEVVLKSGEGAIVKGQVLAMEYATGKYVKYNTGGSGGTDVAKRVAYEAADSTSADVNVTTIKEGAVIRTELVGVDTIVSEDEMSTPIAPTLALVAGGSLTTGTTYTYKVVGTNAEGKTAAGATAAAVPTVATAGTATSENAYADIAAVNAVLGDCSVTNKITILNVDGTTYAITFDLDYSGAGALADWAALIAKLDTAGSTTTGSDTNEIVVTSDTTGAASVVEVISDGSGLLGTAVEVAGVAAKQTIRVTPDEISKATGYTIYRSTDAFASVSAYRAMSAAEILAGYVDDTGSLSYTNGTATTVSDYEAYAQLEKVDIDVIEDNSGYTKRNA